METAILIQNNLIIAARGYGELSSENNEPLCYVASTTAQY